MNSVMLQDTKLIQRNLLHFYTQTTKVLKEKFRKQSYLPLHEKQENFFGINLPKEAKDLYFENCKTLMKEIEADTHTDEKIDSVL